MFSKKKVSSNKKIGKSSDVRFERSNSARRNFLKEKRGLFFSRLYVCSYCGKPITTKSLEVDHCIPVDAARESSFVRSYIRFLGLFQGKKMRAQGINGTWNLVAACDNCNATKSNKGGIWVVRGIIGRYLFPMIWYTGIAVLGVTFAQFVATGGGLWRFIFKGLGIAGEWLSTLSQMFV